MNIGILSLQGNFIQHKILLERLNIKYINIVLIKNRAHLTQCHYDAFIIPGGESSTMLHLLEKQDMRLLFHSLICEQKIPVLATCAGIILLATAIINEANNKTSDEAINKMVPLGISKIIVERNAYGRQADSFIAEVPFAFPHNTPTNNIQPHTIKGLFIRAPKIIDVPKIAIILSTYEQSPVIIQEDNLLLSTFHPEALYDTVLHSYFIETMVK